MRVVPWAADNSWLDGKYATGDWDGERARLLDEGVEPFLYYTAIFSGNPVGGFRQGATYVDDFYFGFNLDLSKLIGWTGGKFTISGVNRDGLGLTDHYIRSRYDVQQTVGGQTIFLYQVFLDQHFWDNKVSLKIGHFGASDDFNGASSIYSRYLNNGVDGDIRNVLFDTQFSAYPFATWAARLRVEPTTDTSVQLGIFQTWQDIFNPSNHGLNWAIRGSDGVFIIAEYGWSPEFWKQPVQTTDEAGKDGGTTELRGLPGHYHIGGSISPWNGYTEFGSGRQVSNSYGFYVHGDQMVYQERPGSDEGLTLWAASGLLPAKQYLDYPVPGKFRRYLHWTCARTVSRPDDRRIDLRQIQPRLRADGQGRRQRRPDLRDGAGRILPGPVHEIFLGSARPSMGQPALRHRTDSERARDRR